MPIAVPTRSVAGVPVSSTDGCGSSCRATTAYLAELATPGAAIAVTGADVRTLRGLQAKGHVVALGPEAPADHAHMLRHCDEFFDTIVELDGIPRQLLERMRPVTYAVCEIEVESLFDQTPGPGAGRPTAEQQA